MSSCDVAGSLHLQQIVVISRHVGPTVPTRNWIVHVEARSVVGGATFVEQVVDPLRTTSPVSDLSEIRRDEIKGKSAALLYLGHCLGVPVRGTAAEKNLADAAKHDQADDHCDHQFDDAHASLRYPYLHFRFRLRMQNS